MSDVASISLPPREHLLSQAAEAAKREIARRVAAQDHLLDFATYTMPGYRIGPPHRVIAEALEAVERGDIRRLMVMAPPRNGKSELVSKRFPAWYLGRNPSRQIISASYGQDLAGDWGRDVRNILASPEYHAIFPGVSLSEDSRAKVRWHTRHGGGYVAAGVGSSITGRGANVLSIDDPLKDRAEADSETVRESTWAWFRATAYTRLQPGGAVILTCTRWHEDDLAGRLLDAQADGGDIWHVIKLPAINDAGEPLWPEAYDRAALDGIRAAIGERDWASLYQQHPRPLAGALFKVEMINMLDAPPAGGAVVRAWDLAATAQTGSRDPDWTVGVKLQRDAEGRFAVLDVVRFRGGPDEVERGVVATASRDGRSVRIGLAQDPGAAGKSALLYLTRKLAGYRVESSPETGEKSTRAGPLAAQVNVGNLALIRAPWNASYIEEMRGFPNASKDDQIDASSRAFSMLVVPRGPARRASIPFVGR